MAETFYDLLDVSEAASTETIEDAYREAIKRVHPDVSDDVDAGERTKRLNKAKRVLTDDDERARYDRMGHDAYCSGGPANSTGGPSTGSGSSAGTGPSRGGKSSSGGRSSSGSSGTATGAGSHRSRGGGSTGGSYRSSRGRQRRARASETTAGRANQSGSERAASGDGWSGRSARGSSGQGRSKSSTGPSWQSARAGRATAGAATTAGDGPSGRRQAAAGSTDGPNTDWSWNAWEQTRSWAVRQGSSGSPGFHPRRVVPDQQSAVLLASTFFLYPFFVGSALFPPFPLVARLLVGTCTLLMFAYLLSVPEIAVTVFGLWGVLTPVALVALPGVGLFSLAGVAALSATWVPLGCSLLTLSVLET